MATLNAPGLTTPIRAGITGDVNQVSGVFTAPTGNAAIGSILNMCKVPPHSRIVGMEVTGSNNTASLTFKAGYADVDGDAAFTDDDALVVAATSLATAATRARMNNPAFPFVDVTKESYITITTAGAALVAGTSITVVVLYAFRGHP